MIVKSEDLPQMKLLGHESLAENMCNRLETDVFGLRFFAQAFLIGNMAASLSGRHVPPRPKKGLFP
ncbi:MAG: hypothetical protein IJD60_00190 [Clostridia bacterium]|nr:hypothetical protein [Clostridia bacterium]